MLPGRKQRIESPREPLTGQTIVLAARFGSVIAASSVTNPSASHRRRLPPQPYHHLGVAVKPPHGLAAADRTHVILDGIAGHHRLAKLALVDGQK
jgi:hypothetical protein